MAEPGPAASPLPRAAGIGLRAPHVAEVLAARPAVAWLEVHSENYFCDGGPALAQLLRVRVDYPVSLHGVGLSLGSAQPPDAGHLRRLKRLAERIEPAAVSDHLSWGAAGGRHLNELLPLPLTEEALEQVCRNVAAAQEALGRRILVENVSSYLRYRADAMPECEFVAEVAARTGCGLLLDVNNIYVSARNHGFDAGACLAHVCAAAGAAVEEIHLAGFEERAGCLIDTHSRPVADPVWNLYDEAIARLGPRPTLIEWDADIPRLPVLLAERDRAQAVLDQSRLVVAA